MAAEGSHILYNRGTLLCLPMMQIMFFKQNFWKKNSYEELISIPLPIVFTDGENYFLEIWI